MNEDDRATLPPPPDELCAPDGEVPLSFLVAAREIAGRLGLDTHDLLVFVGEAVNIFLDAERLRNVVAAKFPDGMPDETRKMFAQALSAAIQGVELQAARRGRSHLRPVRSYEPDPNEPEPETLDDVRKRLGDPDPDS